MREFFNIVGPYLFVGIYMIAAAVVFPGSHKI